jgi:flagellar hook-basal body complex protein FliE
MDALAALQMMTGPSMGAQLDNVVKNAAAQTIPAQELQTVNTDMAAQAVSPAQNSSPSSFSNLLGNFVGEVNAQQGAAGDAINGLLSGKNVSLHQTMISMEEASVSFQMMVEVRNKLLDSYQELMRMQI